MFAHSGQPIGLRGCKRSVIRGRLSVLMFLASCVLLQVVFFPLSDQWPPLADGEYGHKLANLRRQVSARSANQPVVVMFGASMVGWGLNPESMQNLQPGKPDRPVVFNLGINSSGVFVQLMCLKRLLADGIRP